MIKLFTENLPYKLREQMTFEYNRRLGDINYFISGKYDYYSHLKKDIETIELLLALSIFYKRVLSNFDSATKFTSRVIFNTKAVSVQLGTYDLSTKEIFKLNKTVLSFKALMEEYSIPFGLFEYIETKEFLRKIKVYKSGLDQNKDNG